MLRIFLSLTVLGPSVFFSQAKNLPGRAGKSFEWEALPPALYDVLFDREFLFTVPKGPLKGIIFAFPGCFQHPAQWGFTSSHCPLCAGLPEELLIVATAVQRKYAVVTVGPHLSGDIYMCWQKTWPPEANIEIPELKRAIRHVLEERNWWRLPRYFYGSSAGGAAALLLATRFPVQAVASMFMGFKPDEMYKEEKLVSRNIDREEGLNQWPFPPVFLLEAAIDQPEYGERIHKTLGFLKEQGVHAEHMILQPHPLHPLFFSERIAEIDPALSAALYEDLRAAGFINATGYSDYLTIMLEDPDEEAAREVVMRDKLYNVLEKHFSQKMGIRGPLHDGYMRVFIELFRASQGNHEIRGKEMDLIIDFFEQNSVPDLERINGNTHDLVGQADSQAEVLIRKTGLEDIMQREPGPLSHTEGIALWKLWIPSRRGHLLS
ncbi:hypothetical protein WJX75_003600 [Coccomyxa subellipsoidea]|uniref:Alpha/beta-hydrolase n=1 Tax=Coccomyxa subellipsoidea TaxID=248742 RepID=A0ABR2YXX0_9CHLO